MRVCLVVFSAVFGLIACGKDAQDGATAGDAAGGAGGSSGASGSSGGSGSNQPDDEVGLFNVLLDAPVAATGTTNARPGSTSIVGSVGDKPVTESKIWELQSENGSCKLLVPRVPFCDPSCGSGEICVEDGTCVTERVSVDAGTVTISGVMTNAGADSVELISARNTYQNGTTTLPYPAFAEGDPITLDATGAGAVPAFHIEAKGIAPLEVIANADYLVTGETDLALSWTPPSMPDVSRIFVKLDISHHGGEKGKIECDVEDNGALTLPADMLGDLVALGVAGFPTIKIIRSAKGTAQLPNGRVRLYVYQYDERAVTVPGVVSCESEAQCQSGETCRDNKTCG